MHTKILHGWFNWLHFQAPASDFVPPTSKTKQFAQSTHKISGRMTFWFLAYDWDAKGLPMEIFISYKCLCNMSGMIDYSLLSNMRAIESLSFSMLTFQMRLPILIIFRDDAFEFYSGITIFVHCKYMPFHTYQIHTVINQLHPLNRFISTTFKLPINSNQRPKTEWAINLLIGIGCILAEEHFHIRNQQYWASMRPAISFLNAKNAFHFQFFRWEFAILLNLLIKWRGIVALRVTTLLIFEYCIKRCCSHSLSLNIHYVILPLQCINRITLPHRP